MIEKTIVISERLKRKLDNIMLDSPELNLSLIVNQALEEWLKCSHSIKLRPDPFIIDNSKGFGPRLSLLSPVAVENAKMAQPT